MQQSNLLKIRTLRCLILISGLIACQFVLYGPSLLGRKILLPLETLAYKRIYLPHTAEWEHVKARHPAFSDEILGIEFRRLFAASEVRAGRLPLWNPDNYCGAPFMAANNTAVFSPFTLPSYLFPSPITIAWVQLLKALVAGTGAFVFFRTVLRVRYWPATLAAWCYPLTWFFVLWRGYPPSFVIAWLPWLLVATDSAVRRPRGWGGIALALLTALVMVSGQAATAAHVLIASGMYALWCVADEYGIRNLLRAGPFRSVLTVAAGWALGFALSAPQNLPTAEYLQWSNRVAVRAAGEAELLVLGSEAWPLLVLPYLQGAALSSSNYLLLGNAAEGPPAGYAGFLVAMVLAPLAFMSRRHRSATIFWVVAIVVSVSFIFSIPLLRLPFGLFPLNLLKNNRFVFLVAWSVTALAAIGMDALWRRRFTPRWWFIVPLTVAGVLGFICLHHAFDFPLTLRRKLGYVANSQEVRQWFHSMYLASAAFCLVPILLWAGLLAYPVRWWRWCIGGLALAELLVMAYGVNPQCDPNLYYPEIQPLSQLAERIKQEPGRICGFACLPPNTNQRYGFSDIRGYDGVDPKHLVALLNLCQRHLPANQVSIRRYAVTQYFRPIESPLLDMLNLRYRIFRGEPPAEVNALFAGDDYWVLESKTYLPRVYLPQQAATVDTPEKALQGVAKESFDPRRIAYAYSADDSFTLEDVKGNVAIVSETPCNIDIDVDLETPGLVVLADLYMPGWKAFYNDEPVTIYLTNVALRSVRLPPGKGRLTFRYEPESFAAGLRWMWTALAIVGMWGAALLWIPRRQS